jgi:tetratricopeptide (TPR) repeat protein
LLTGVKPFPVAGRTVAVLERAVLDTPAPAPSSVVKRVTLARQLRGDLDRIVLMALRKEPERRYVSAGQFGEDIERYLTRRPVMARPDSVGYRLSKFIRRNRALMAGAAAAAFLLVAFGATATLQARKISRERDRAERERATAEGVLRILTDLFEQGNPNTHPGGDTLRVTSLLDDAERKVGTMSGDAVRQAALWRAVGNMRTARGEYARALDLLTRSYEQRKRLFGPDDIEAARTHHEIAQALAWYRGESVARPMLDSSLTELRRLLGERSPDVRQALNDLLMVTFDSVAARRLLAELADLDKRSPTPDPIAIAERLNDQAARYLNEGRNGDAVALFRASLDILHRQLPPEHDNTRTVQRNLAMALVADGQFAQAESLQRVELAVESRRRGSLPTRGMAEEALALTLAKVGRIDSAVVHERAALTAFRGGMGLENWRIWSAQRNLALLESVKGRLTEGLALLDTAIDLARAGPDGRTEAGYLMAQRAPILIRLGRLRDAAQSIASAEHELGTSAAVTRAHRADVERYAGVVELALGHAARAADRFRSAVALVESGSSPRSPPATNSCLLGVALVRVGMLAEAAPLVGGPCTVALARGPNDPLVVEWIAKARAVASSRRP